MNARTTALLLVLAAPAAAVAQSSSFYVAGDSSDAYAAPEPGSATTLFTESDDGQAVIDFTTLPGGSFTFGLFGRTVTKMHVSVNGAVAFNAVDSVTGQVYVVPGTNVALPSNSQPKGRVAVVWDDWVATALAPGGGSAITWSLVGTAPDRTLVIDWARVQLYGATGANAPTYSFQLRLVERLNQLETRYGPRVNVDNGSLLSFTSAVENYGATTAINALACSPNCLAADWPTAIRGRIVSPNQNAELSAAVGIEGNENDGPKVRVTITNIGQAAATGVIYRVYASSDDTLDTATDTLLYETPGPGVSVGIRTATTDDSVFTEVRSFGAGTPGENLLGQRRVFVVVDPERRIVELNRTNNTAMSSATYVAGSDLTIDTGAQGSAILGETVVVNVTLRNSGVRAVRGTIVRFKLAGGVLTAPRLLGDSDPIDVPAEGRADVAVNVRLPSDVIPAAFQVQAVVDPDNAVTEVDENNNAANPLGMLIRGADIGVVAVAAGSQVAYRGGSVPVKVTLVNRGLARADNFRFSVFLSANDVITLRDIKIFSSSTVSLGPNSTRVFTEDALVPSTTPLGTYYVGIIVDAEGVVLETDRTNNVRRAPDTLTVSPEVADLSIASVAAASRTAAGETLRVTGLLTNIGARPATAASYGVYLSPNPLVSSADLRLADAVTTLGPGEQLVVSMDARVPAIVAPGDYYVGIVVNPDHAIEEASYDNNVAVADSAVGVAGASLTVTTPRLPDGVVGVDYSAQFAALGAAGAVQWSVAGGALPGGLSLSPGGALTGAPTAAGASSFVIRASAGGIDAFATYVLTVRSFAPSLGLGVERLPSARRGRSYSAAVPAIGGVPPYLFSLVDGALPDGLSLAETGVVSGLPSLAGGFTATVRVVDAIGHVAEGSVAVEVLSDAGGVIIGSNRIPDFTASKQDSQRLNVSGGQPPYLPQVLAGALPDGLSVGVDASGAVVSISGTPATPGTYGFTLSVSDARGDRDIGQFAIRVKPREVTFVTLLLPDASPGSDYSFKLDSNARPPAAYTLVGGELPPGLSLAADGTIAGTVDSAAPQVLYAFAVEVSETTTGGRGLSAFAIDVPAPERVALQLDGAGCSSGAGSWLALLPLLGFLRRRRGFPVVVVALAVGLVPLVAEARYVVDRSSTPYVDCPTTKCAQTLLSSGQTPAAIASSFPFTFRYWGQSFTTVSVSPTGYVAFGPLSRETGNSKIPSPSSPNNIVAPFWDNLVLAATGSAINVGTSGTAPNRVFTIEWRNMQMTGFNAPTNATYSFQVELYETTNVIKMRYGGAAATSTTQATFTATIGIESPTGTEGFELSDVNCSPGCTAASFPVNQVVQLTPAPDLVIDRVVTPSLLFAGAPVSLRAVVRNAGGAAVTGGLLRYVLSTDTLIDSADTLLGTSPAFTVGEAGTVTVSSQFVVPESAEVGLYQLLVRADPDEQVREVLEENNDAAPSAVAVAPEAPDFTVTRLLSASVADAGRPLAITRTIRNQGNVAGTVAYELVLSTNDVASASDLVLEQGDGPLGAGASLDGVTNVVIPAEVPAGRYWIGLLVHPSDGAAELDSQNNDRVLGPIVVRGGNLAIVSTHVPEVLAGIPFAFQFEGTGGAGDLHWLAAGALPGGVSLSDSGVLSGILEAEGEYPFGVQLASGSSVVTGYFTLSASSPSVPLTFAAGRLPSGLLGVPYSGNLSAVGGTPPYRWALSTGAAMPSGLTLASDGAIEGVPLVDGTSTIAVTVTDTAGATASGEVIVDVAGPDRPIVSTHTLANASAGQAYTATLDVAGGVGPYRFAVLESRRVPLAFDTECELLGDCLLNRQAPPGLELSEEGVLSGSPTGVGVYVVLVQAIDARAIPSAPASLLLAVEGGSGLSIITARLPDAEAGTEYAAKLEATGGLPPYTWSAVFAEGVALPSLLQFLPDGRIAGYPRAPGNAAFMAVARDAQGRLAVRPMGIRVVAQPTVPPASGCGSSEGSLLALVALALLGARRRRSGAAAALFALLVSVSACLPVIKPPCATECTGGTACDPLDGLCKCGGSGGAVCGGATTCDAVSKSCVAPACDATCAAPMVCGTGGVCHCGSFNGPVCSGAETCNPDGRCVTPDPCADVVCGRGLACNPATGQCVCGTTGAGCADGKRCSEGACVDSVCLGVSCTGGTSCDTVDGHCKCGGEGGAVCANGEACDTTNARCLRSDLCANVSCRAGEACDPTTGECRCGGIGGPSCEADQTCDAIHKACTGGDRCRNVTCGTGSACDPESGVCRCGTVTCGDGQACLDLEAGKTCVTPCSPFGDACPGELGCVFDLVSRTPFCAAVGPVVAAGTCATDNLCATGLFCQIPDNETDGTCRPYCQGDEQCAVGETCATFLPGNPLGFCIRRTE